MCGRWRDEAVGSWSLPAGSFTWERGSSHAEEPRRTSEQPRANCQELMALSHHSSFTVSVFFFRFTVSGSGSSLS
jgi:hypothetical protein